MIDRRVLQCQHAEEEQTFITTHPRSAVLAKEAEAHLLGGVPMAWMTRWPGSFPIFFDTARGARFTDVDGLEYSVIAEHLGIPLNTVRTRISRGRKYIADRVQEQFRSGGSLG